MPLPLLLAGERGDLREHRETERRLGLLLVVEAGIEAVEHEDAPDGEHEPHERPEARAHDRVGLARAGGVDPLLCDRPIGVGALALVRLAEGPLGVRRERRRATSRPIRL